MGCQHLRSWAASSKNGSTAAVRIIRRKHPWPELWTLFPGAIVVVPQIGVIRGATMEFSTWIGGQTLNCEMLDLFGCS